MATMLSGYLHNEIDEIGVKIGYASQAKNDDNFIAMALEIEEVLESIKSLGLATYKHIDPMAVGVYWANRYGNQIDADSCHALGAKIVRTGWSNMHCQSAICIEDTDTYKSAQFTWRMQKSSPRFGESPPGKMKYGSLTCSHTNQFLVAALSGAQSRDHEDLCTNGHMDKARIIIKAPSMAEPLYKGMKWLVLKAQVADLFPSLPGLIIQIRQLLGRRISQFELLGGIDMEISNATDPNSIDWRAIHEVARLESEFANDLSVLCEYCSCQIGWVMKNSEVYVLYI